MNLGRLYLFQERWQHCGRHLNAAIPLYEEVGANANLNLNDAYYLQALLNLAQGQIGAARQWAARSYELLRKVTGTDKGESVEWGRYEQLAGRIALAEEHLPEARRHFDTSLSIFRTNGSQLELGRAAYWSAVLSLACGETARAKDELNLANEVFMRLGATADLKRVEAKLQQAVP
jgi:tetratricopeptide (TPR) repeat protein